MNAIRLRVLAGLVLVGLLGVAGCGGGARMAKVHGKVTLDGEPVPNGAVNFDPVDGQSPTAGAVIQNGEYTTEVPYGTMNVKITAPKVIGKRKLYDAPDSPTRDIVRELIPPEYNVKSKLQEEIKPDTSEVNFELKSK